MEKQRWQNSVVYQIYPKSFCDTNNDGIGDINGITEKLDYIKYLGADFIWICPIYCSPNDDNGYDISDYYNINPEAGTMEDLERLISEADKRGMKIIMDLVVNHTSDEHKWFVEAKKGKDNPYRDYYVWADPVNGSVPNDIRSAFGGSAWELDEESGQYYLHLFSKKQPDLNWENPQMRREIYDMMNFWIDKGIGGFRMDVIEYIGKKPLEKITANGPMLHEYLQEMNAETFGKKDLLTVGECWAADTDIAKLYCAPERHELSMVFQFEHIGLRGNKWNPKRVNLTDLKKLMNKWQSAMHERGTNTLFWNNHDIPRVVSTFGNDKEYRVQSAKMLAVMMYCMEGTPFIFQGEELGMTNAYFKSIDECRDIETLNMYNERKQQGVSDKDILEKIRASSRDNARTPMQWDSSENAGFTQGMPWIGVNDNYSEINAAAEMQDENSVLNFYKRLIAMRKECDALIYGSFVMLDESDDICAYDRIYNGKRIRVVCNYTDKNVSVDLDMNGALLLSNYNSQPDGTLRPYEAAVIEM